MGRKKTPTSQETFGERLARLRKARGFSQTELGELVGMSQRMMVHYEGRAIRVSADHLARLASALNVPMEELMGLRPVDDKPARGNTRLWRKFREIENLPAGDRRVVLKILDGLLARQKLVSSGSGR